MGLSPRDGYRLVSSVYDLEPNPILSLEQRFLEQLLPPVKGLDVVDLGCGTGRWLAKFAEKAPRSLVGMDFSAEMLAQAKLRLGTSASLVLADCSNLPFPRSSANIIVCSFLISYLPDLDTFAHQIRRLLRPGGSIFLSDLHPATSASLGWRRGFNVDGSFVDIATHLRPIKDVLGFFETFGIDAKALFEPHFGAFERQLFRKAGKMGAFEAATGLPATYIAQLGLRPRRAYPRGKNLRSAKLAIGAPQAAPGALVHFVGAQIALGPQEALRANLTIENGRITLLKSAEAAPSCPPKPGKGTFDLSGFLLLPGLTNAHDHLEFALFPRLGKGGYRNFVEWIDDIHHPEASPVREHCAVPKEVRLWWGGIRNLLCGVTTVCHHNPYVEEVFDKGFPIRVQRAFSWAHSLHLDDEIARKQTSAPPDQPFILHLAEGIDSKSASEIVRLAEQKALTERTVIVHGLGLDETGFALLRSAGAALIWCPTSNVFLFGRTHNRKTLECLRYLALGSDSPLTASGDLLDEIRFAAEAVGLPIEQLYLLVTTKAAQVLRLKSGEGTLRIGALADFIAVPDNGHSPAHTLAALTYRDVELVVIGGQVQLASSELFRRLPRLVKTGLHALEIEGELRWIRAPLDRLFTEAQRHLPGEIKVGGRRVRHGLST